MLRRIMTRIDLKLHWPIISDFQDFGGQSGYAHRQTCVLAIDGISALASVRHVRPTVSRRPEDQIVFVCRAVPRHGLRAADVSPQPARNRNMLASDGREAVPHGHSQPCFPKQSLSCQRDSRLANLCRLRSSSYLSGAIAVCRRKPGHRSGRDCLRVGRIDDRSVPFDVSLGQVSQDPGVRSNFIR